MRSLSAFLLALCLAAGASAQAPEPLPYALTLPDADARGSLHVRGATVHTVTGGTLENADVTIEDGIITGVGPSLRTPRGARVIDGAGMHVMPGIIDAHSHLGITSVNEATNPIVAEVQIQDVLNPFDVGLYRALAGGVTATHAMHGSANPVGGQGETIKLRYGTTDPEGLVMEDAPRTIKFALGENPTRVHGQGRNVRPRSRAGIEQVYREAFTEARLYRDRQNAFAAAQREGRAAIAPPYDLRMETLADILDGEILVHCHSYRADEIAMLMRVLSDFGVERVTFQHGNEAFKVAPELAAFGPDGAGASVFSDWYNYKFEVYYSTAYNAAILTRNGVRTSINSDSAELIRHLNHEAAKTMHYGGLEPDEALALITINPAWQLGIDDRVGSIEVGKEGDLAIFDANPLSVYAVNQYTVVDGVVRFDRAAQPDDMRILVNPDVPVDEVMVISEEGESCLVDVFLQ